MDISRRPLIALDMSHDQSTVTSHTDHLSTRRTLATVTHAKLTAVTAANEAITTQLTHLTLYARLHTATDT